MTDVKTATVPPGSDPQQQPGLSSGPPAPSYDAPPPYLPPPYPTAISYAPAWPYPAPPTVAAMVPPPPGEIGFKVSEQLPPVDSEAPAPCETSVPVGCVELVVSAFDDKNVRRAFIRKVFCVLTIQLLVTFSIVCLFTFWQGLKQAVQKNLWIYLSSYIIFVVVALVVEFCGSIRRRHPWNLIALGTVTLSLSYMVGTVASFHNTTAVLIAMGSTLAITFAVIGFSAQTRVDFTYCNGLLLVLAVDLVMFGFFSCFFYSSVLQVLYGSLGALLFSLFLAVDSQLVLGRQKYALSAEEYVFAALILYLDIIMVFLYLLILLGGSSNN